MIFNYILLMSSTASKTIKKAPKKAAEVQGPTDNGKALDFKTDLPRPDSDEVDSTGKHIEIPESTEYFMNLKRKQNNNKMFLNLNLKGPKDSKDFLVNLTYPDYDMPVPELVKQTVKSLERYLRDYARAQERALEQTPSLESFFLAANF